VSWQVFKTEGKYLFKEESMATLTSHHHSYMRRSSTTERRLSLYAVPIGRTLFSLIFIMSGINHFSSGSVSYAANQGVPMADILVPISGIIALIGGLSILTGTHARVGAVLILMFLIPVTFIMHNFWAVSDPAMAQMQMTHFMKNIAMIGGAVLLAFYGAGPVSIDHHMAKRRS
jgi:putative oxidoreductase